MDLAARRGMTRPRQNGAHSRSCQSALCVSRWEDGFLGLDEQPEVLIDFGVYWRSLVGQSLLKAGGIGQPRSGHPVAGFRSPLHILRISCVEYHCFCGE